MSSNPKRNNADVSSDSDNSSDDDGSISPPASKSRKTKSTNLGVVDPESNITGGKIVIVDDHPCDCMLVKVNPNINVDNFFVLQLIKCNSRCVIYKRFGRTGTIGMEEREDFDEEDDAVESFEESFKELTGLDWKVNRHGTPVNGKYSFIEQNFTEKRRGYSGAKFQYYIGDGVDGKNNGWHDFESSANPYVEQLFHEYVANPQLTNRLLTMGHFTYNIDLVQMTQTNIGHRNRKQRTIRRCIKKQIASQPLASSVVHVPVPVQTKTPDETIPYSAPINMIDIAVSKIIPVTTPISESDNTCVICLSEMTDDEDVVQFDMPDCSHIFHHDCIKKAIQLSKPCCPTCRKPIDEVQGSSPSGTMTISTTSRVCSGFESSIGTIVVTYDLPGDVQREYHPNPNVRFHSTSRCGYIPDTQEGKELLLRLKYAWRKGLLFTVGTSMTTGATNVITWGSVHHKTSMYGGAHGFPDANFFRNCNFELDILGVPEASDIATLPRLNQPPAAVSAPVAAAAAAGSNTSSSTSTSQTLSRGAAAALRPMTAGGATPSHRQIQSGISVLNEIKSKINGQNVTETYAELSSRFYTVIPHSFGRRRPPVISNISVLQSTIDACYYLLQN